MGVIEMHDECKSVSECKGVCECGCSVFVDVSGQCVKM